MVLDRHTNIVTRWTGRTEGEGEGEMIGKRCTHRVSIGGFSIQFTGKRRGVLGGYQMANSVSFSVPGMLPGVPGFTGLKDSRETTVKEDEVE